jgi:hypothetical protein
VGKYSLFILLVLLTSRAFSQTDTAQTESVTSRLYFPGMVGVNLHLYDQHQHYKRGFVLNTGIEYRPDNNPWFFRFNYDAVSSNYKSDAGLYQQTNVQNGTLHVNYFIAGAGYRKKVRGIGWYVLAQTGLEQRNYDRVSGNESGYIITQLSKTQLAFKLAGGFEYYLAKHFALVAEPAFYPNLTSHHSSSSNGNLTMSVGFTTTLF